MTTETPTYPRSANGRFAPGHPGRRFGSRNRLSGRIARAILKDFETSQDDMLAKLKRWYVPQYVALLARLLPKAGEEAGGPVLDQLDDGARAGVVAAIRAMLDRIDAGEANLTELEAVLLDGDTIVYGDSMVRAGGDVSREA
jgi:hypothetical protein